jgi:putative ABC transport system permease protein
MFGPQVPSLTLWVPPEMADELTAVVQRDLQAALPGNQTDVYPMGGSIDLLEGGARWVVTGIGAVALLLGGLGLLNISLVTVRYRIREIGIRRSFGATSGRVFFGVLMESVVATVVAGLVGVVGAVVVVKNIPVEQIFGVALDDTPPFPTSAALLGLACATAVGALAGLVPALVAVRVKVIDAIRY